MRIEINKTRLASALLGVIAVVLAAAVISPERSVLVVVSKAGIVREAVRGSRIPSRVIRCMRSKDDQAAIGVWEDGNSVFWHEGARIVATKEASGQFEIVGLRDTWLAGLKIRCAGADRGLHASIESITSSGSPRHVPVSASGMHWQLYFFDDDLNVQESLSDARVSSRLALSVTIALTGTSNARRVSHGFIIADATLDIVHEIARSLVSTSNLESESRVGIAPAFGLQAARISEAFRGAHSPAVRDPDCERKFSVSSVRLEYEDGGHADLFVERDSGFPSGQWVAYDPVGVRRSSGVLVFGRTVGLTFYQDALGVTRIKSTGLDGAVHEISFESCDGIARSWSSVAADGSIVQMSYGRDGLLDRIRLGLTHGSASALPVFACLKY